MKLINNIYINEFTEFRISRITQRLKNSVSEVEVVRWLENFNPSEINYALLILENLEYVTEKELIEYLDIRLSKLRTLLKKKQKAFFIPVAKYGKSSTLLIYYLLKSPLFLRFNNQFEVVQSIEILDEKFQSNYIPKNSAFVFIDDFLGSGSTLIDFYKTEVQPVIDKHNKAVDLYSLSIYYLGKGERKIKKEIPTLTIIGDKKFSCFQRGKSPFSSEMIPQLREFCYNYGINLFETTKPKKKHPLGYYNSQALVIFPYNPPNNSLPIIWSSKYNENLDRNWHPLYPRVSKVKMEQSKKIRSDLAYELSLLRYTEVEAQFLTGKQKLSWGNKAFIQKTDFKLFAFLRLKMQKRSPEVISQILGITINDLNEIIDSAIQKGIINKEVELTIKGKTIYNNILKALSRYRSEINYLKRDSMTIKERVYLPHKFRGQTRS